MTITQPMVTGSLEQDRGPVCRYLLNWYAEMEALPQAERRAPDRRQRIVELRADATAVREAFLRRHVVKIYARLTADRTRELRVAELLEAAHAEFPGLVPGPDQLAKDRRRGLKDKNGVELDQGIFLSHVLDDEGCGRHLLRAMARPRPEARRLLDTFTERGEVDLGPVAVRHASGVGYVSLRNHDCLNAEDDDSIDALEIAVDLVLLCDRVDVGVLRGDPATHPKWAGHRIFGSGINLTRLYRGEISLVGFFVNRELGAVDKMYRGHPGPATRPDDLETRHEKPWIAVVDAFAIGGGCQFLLVMDRVVAETRSWFSLPAGQEGIVPGCGVMRLPRFVGEGVAREAVLFGRRFDAPSPVGRQIANDVVEPAGLDAAVDAAVTTFRAVGPPGVAANRRMMRLGAEPVDRFRRYMAGYVREQAECIFGSEMVVRNLEQSWISRNR